MASRSDPHRHLRTTTVSAALACVACEAPLEIDAPYVWRGEHLEIRSDTPLERWCAGALRSADEFVGHAKAMHEVQEGEVVISYVLERPFEEYGPLCDVSDAELAGCIREGEGIAYTHIARHDHEFVHAIRTSFGNTPRFFEEGAATYWGGVHGPGHLDRVFDLVEEPPSVLDTLDAAQERSLTIWEYGRAAHFTSYLVHTYGTEAQVSILRGVDWGESRARQEGAFIEATGVALEDAVDEYDRDWPWCSLEAVQSPFVDCAGEPISIRCEPGDNQTTIEVATSCDDLAVIGPQHGWVWRYVVVDVPPAVMHIVGAHVPDPVGSNTEVFLKRCDTDCSRAEPVVIPAFDFDSDEVTGSKVLELDPGRHLFYVARRENQPLPVELRWQCLPGT